MNSACLRRDRITQAYFTELQESVQKFKGVVGEAQAKLFDGIGGESVDCVGVGDSRLMQQCFL